MKETFTVPCNDNEITLTVDNVSYQYLALRRASLDVAPLESVNVTLTDEPVDGHAYYEVAGFSVMVSATLADHQLAPGDYTVYRATPGSHPSMVIQRATPAEA
ncbi:hypothetical protein [Lentilactobacillus farraginis]|uniref:Uncharacterized protein n=1 Tax=Lentilactobacillus farraginis DSM 18382 = JCM 14108 TaxID=1423743 RepID=X0QE33_9LACO|nr:hypothetical protein [Lentilactobacillus farraginis]KRM06357.1 hypothetical protein FD41_GL000628 [Lentilactobacillus farraginis DSM 18382 = JCM 14108]GAF36890.1 hypothetical protein JCM14108_1883 [Lentilactobacillus farraginis DSM 18382 = JCM 14108]